MVNCPSSVTIHDPVALDENGPSDSPTMIVWSSDKYTSVMQVYLSSFSSSWKNFDDTVLSIVLAESIEVLVANRELVVDGQR